MNRKAFWLYVIFFTLADCKKIFKNFKNKNLLKNAGMIAGTVALGELSWSGISDEFNYLEARVSALESMYHDEIHPMVEEISLIQSSVYPIFAIFIIFSLIGVIFLGKKIKREDFPAMLSRLARVPEYLNRLRSNPLFSHNQTQASAPFYPGSEFAQQRQNPYYNNPIPLPPMANNPIIAGNAQQNGPPRNGLPPENA